MQARKADEAAEEAAVADAEQADDFTIKAIHAKHIPA